MSPFELHGSVSTVLIEKHCVQLQAGLNRIIAVVGPTASGKGALSVYLAQHLGAEIISMDSMKVYRGLDIGAAKPSREDQEKIPHHLLDITDPDEDFTAADFVRLADKAINAILANQKQAILCGGAGFYLKALLFGLYSSPPSDDSIRQELREAADKGDDLYKRLKETDPLSAKSIHPNDTYRIIRALEVHIITGKPLSEIKDAHSAEPRYEATIIAPVMEREALYSRIEKRADKMLETGLVDEVKALKEKGYGRELKPFLNMGYKYIWAHVEGEMSIEDAMDLLKRDTRRYAKRQLTWFRNQSDVLWVESGEGGMSDVQMKKAAEIVLQDR